MEGRRKKLDSQPRERERDLSSTKTSEAAEGNEVIPNKSNFFGGKKTPQNSFRFCFYYGEIREDSPGERRGASAVALSPSWRRSRSDSLRAPSGKRSLSLLDTEKCPGFPHF